MYSVRKEPTIWQCFDYLNCQITQNLFSSTVLWHKNFMLTSTAIPCIKQRECPYSVAAAKPLFCVSPF